MARRYAYPASGPARRRISNYLGARVANAAAVLSLESIYTTYSDKSRERGGEYAQQKRIVVGFCTEGGGVVILDRGGRTSRPRLIGEYDGLVAEDLRGIRSTRRGAIDLRAGRAR